jgi:hypothetical protein
MTTSMAWVMNPHILRMVLIVNLGILDALTQLFNVHRLHFNFSVSGDLKGAKRGT